MEQLEPLRGRDGSRHIPRRTETDAQNPRQGLADGGLLEETSTAADFV